MKHIFFLFPLLLFVLAKSQAQNLIPNPSFEEFENGCPDNLNELPSSWSRWRDSPNSFSTCLDPQNLGDSLGWAPENGFGFQFAAEGQSYVGLYTFGGDPLDYREYMGAQLIEPLEIGQIYYFSMKVSPTVQGFYYNNVQTYSNNIGMQLTTQNYDWMDNPMPINNSPHIHTEQVNTDTTDWYVIEGIVQADSAYTYISLGNFFNNSLTDTIANSALNSLGAYYFIDDLCLSKYPDCTLWVPNYPENVEIAFFPNPTKDICTAQCSDRIISAQLYNFTGDCVELNWSWQNGEVWCDLSVLSSGVYIFISHTKGGVISSKIIVE